MASSTVVVGGWGVFLFWEDISLYVCQQKLQTLSMYTRLFAVGQGDQMVNLCGAQEV